METNAISEGWIAYIQEHYIQEQLEGDGVEEEEKIKNIGEGLKKVIQQAFIKHQIIEFDSIKPLLEDNDSMNELFEAISKKESKEAAREVFNNAIEESKTFIATEYGLSPKRRKAHEILAEELDKKFGEGHISNNVNNLLEKNVGHGGHVCDDGGC